VGVSDDRLTDAVALLREAAEKLLPLSVHSVDDPAEMGSLATRLRAFLAQGPAPSHVVHLLVNGIAACGGGLPYSWPEGDRWTDSGDVSVVTCPACRARRG
jgi:hypothetical protein